MGTEMQRVSVVGCSGAGKTTVARRLAAAMTVPHVELDALHWGPNWTEATPEEMRARVGDAIAGDTWVVDGNYRGKTGTMVWERADTVVWVDPPRWRVMLQSAWRATVRAATRRELWNGNREGFDGLMIWRGDASIVRYAWNTYAGNRARNAAAMIDPAFAHLRFVRLQTRRDVDEFIASVSKRR